MFCFSETCRICKRSTNSMPSTRNNQKEVSNVFFRVFPELMNSKLNLFLKNLCQPCEKQLLSFEKFKNHCIQSDQCYMLYLNQLNDHDSTHAELVCKVGINQEDGQNYCRQIQPRFDKNGIQESSMYYGSAVHSSSFAEVMVKHEFSISGIKEENDGAMVQNEISILGGEESISEEFRDTSTLTNQELFPSDYHRSIKEETVDGEIDYSKETINPEAVEVFSNYGIEDFHLKIPDSSVNTRMENGIIIKQEMLHYDEPDISGIITDYSVNMRHNISNIKPEYYQGKDDFNSIVEGGDESQEITDIKTEYYQGIDDLASIAENITEVDIVKQEVCKAEEDESCSSIDSSIDKPYKCDVCEWRFSRKPDFIRHKRTHTGEKPFACDICERSFPTKSSMIDHKRTHTGEKPYKCDVCKKRFSWKTILINHKRTHTGEKPFECDICKKSFSLRNHLYYHKRVHTGEKPYECDVCKKRFMWRNKLSQHKRTHTGEKPFECDICKKRFSQKCHLLEHMKTHIRDNDNGENPFECDICKKGFAYKNVLINHVRTHTGEKPFECDICKKSFSRKDALISHKKIHTGEKPFECDVCQMRCSRKYDLIKHKRIHTGDKPYDCDLCKKSFSRKNILTAHKRTHTGEKPYECDICKKNFSEKTKLTLHKRTHTGEKPYECDFCKKSFAQQSNLKLHKRTHTGEKPYECDFCKKSFSHKSYLNEHKKTYCVLAKTSVITERRCDEELQTT